MKKVLLSFLLLALSIGAQAQFVPFVPNQILTAQALNGAFGLYCPLTGCTFTGPVSVPSITIGGIPFNPTGTTGSGAFVLQNGPTILNPNIGGGFVNNASVGATTPSTGAFTTLSASSTTAFSGATTFSNTASLGALATATTQGYLDNSTSVATNNFVKRTLLASSATLPVQNVTGGTYNFASVGSGAQIVILASGGAITSVLTIAVAGSGYQVGDCLVMVGGNGDAILRVTSLSGSGVASASVVYGGTGYTTGAQLTGMPLPPGTRTGNITGTLTSNATIVIPSGTLLQGARFVGFDNNTTGAFTVTVKLSNGSGGSTGTGVVLPQGTANSTSVTLYTDGVNDVWLADSPAGIGALSSSAGAVPLTSLATQAANTVVGNFTGSSASPVAFAMPSCTGGSNALGYTSGTGIICNGIINATVLLGFNWAIPGTIGSTTPSTGAFTTLSSTGTFTPSQTNGIVGTTTNNNANAGSVGELLTNSATGTSLSTTVVNNCATLSLTAGDWEASGTVTFNPAGTTTVSLLQIGLSGTSITLPGANLGASILLQATLPTGGIQIEQISSVRFSLASPATIYLVADATFGVSTMTCNGFIRARRVR